MDTISVLALLALPLIPLVIIVVGGIVMDILGLPILLWNWIAQKLKRK